MAVSVKVDSLVSNGIPVDAAPSIDVCDLGAVTKVLDTSVVDVVIVLSLVVTVASSLEPAVSVDMASCVNVALSVEDNLVHKISVEYATSSVDVAITSMVTGSSVDMATLADVASTVATSLSVVADNST